MDGMEKRILNIKAEDCEWESVYIKQERLGIKDEEYEMESVGIKEEAQEKSISIELHKYKCMESVQEDDNHDEYQGGATSSEFASMLSSYSVKHVRDGTLSATDLRSAASKLNLTSIDYRTLGYVTSVQDQGYCGCCWAFSAAGAIEGQTFNKTGKLIPLSKQNLLDCAEYLGNQGCSGGRPSLAFQYVINSGGIQAEATYPYKMAVGSCRFNSSKVVATVANYKYLPIGNEQALADALATIGPVSVVIDATQVSFQFYLSGIYNDPKCSIYNLSHAMLAVGYGFQGSSNYWIIKNSWGTMWGVNGYLLLAKDKNNACGISQYGAVPFV
ncbi:CATL2 protein, partial [Polypterus senegalus]